jgi:hypothetical protein
MSALIELRGPSLSVPTQADVCMYDASPRVSPNLVAVFSLSGISYSNSWSAAGPKLAGPVLTIRILAEKKKLPLSA